MHDDWFCVSSIQSIRKLGNLLDSAYPSSCHLSSSIFQIYSSRRIILFLSVGVSSSWVITDVQLHKMTCATESRIREWWLLQNYPNQFPYSHLFIPCLELSSVHRFVPHCTRLFVFFAIDMRFILSGLRHLHLCQPKHARRLQRPF